MPAVHLLKVSRLEGLTDGVFAIAMTIMILNLHIPSHIALDQSFASIKRDLYINLFIYFGSFIILGTHWIAMNFQWGLLERLNRMYLWTNMFYLMVICIIPFSANLLGAYPNQIHSIHFYAVNLLCASFGQYITLECARYYNLYKKSKNDSAIFRAACIRLCVGPIFYISSLIVAHWNITLAFILLVLPTVIYLIPGRIDHYEGIDTDK